MSWLAGEAEFQVDDEGEEVADKSGVIEEIEHDGIDAAEVGGLGHGTFDPAFDELLAAEALAEEVQGVDAVVHAPAAQGVGES